MTEEPEVHFCNICNASIPETALHDGSAIKLQDRVIPTASRASIGGVTAVRSGGSGGVLPAALVLLVAIAGAVIFLDWRLSEEVSAVTGEVQGLGDRLERQAEQIGFVEKHLADVLVAGDLDPLGARMDGFSDVVTAGERRMQASLDTTGGRIEDIRGAVRDVNEEQIKLSAQMTMLHDEIRALNQDVAEIKAMPRVAAPAAAMGPGTPILPRIDDGVGDGSGLPAAIAHNVSRLSDPEDGARFEAADELLQTKDPRVYAYVIPLAKDPDPWVRRLVLEGLADHRAPETVDVLLTALADPESIVRHTAYALLTTVTGQTIPFDPDSGKDQRAKAQKRWKDWWDKNRGSF